MKLNPKCIRDLLEVFETTVQDANTTYYFESMEDLRENDSLSECTPEELAYHCQQLYLSGFFYHGKLDVNGGLCFMDIMPEAHALLANLRIPKVFKMLQNFIGIAGSASINQMASITTSALTSALPSIMSLAQETLRKTP